MKRLLASTLFALLPASGLADETCSIEVDGLLYHHGECRYSKTLYADRLWSIEVGQKTDDESLGYWVLLLEDSDGTYQGHWNGSYGASHAHNRLGEMQLEDECWIGDDSRICLGVPVGTVPTYRILEGDQSPLDNTVEANLNGTRYVIDHDSWEQVGPYKIGSTKDLDGDGHPETVVELSNGGNCCPGKLSVISYRGDGFFEILNGQPISNGWDGYELVPFKGETLVRVKDRALGADNYEDWQSQSDYAQRDGRLVKLTERFNYAKSVSLMELTAEEVRDAPRQTKSFDFDLDLDGRLDTVTCAYWDRWGSLSCDVQYDGDTQPTKMTCKRFAILPKVSEGYVSLECD
ncbi:hypothetical protein RAZWK3B_09676 [Roseobacter sp. AzwK-3b]|uniref:hypothetical protein n=1 Tax=Roseobacter sp. AzwK-3b TaxID=351016 RepID=UPI0001568D25|nr:hypothetical protein [Roseobacter sp. AzwK-3b]EDM72511.1 hypothetical protein RAZWK3B_09676 [Roseobacter sp. AzwK-3b]